MTLGQANLAIRIESKDNRVSETEFTVFTSNDKDFANILSTTNVTVNGAFVNHTAKGRYVMLGTTTKKTVTEAPAYKPGGKEVCVKLIDVKKPTDPIKEKTWEIPPPNNNDTTPGTQFPNIPDGSVGPPVQPDPDPDPPTSPPGDVTCPTGYTQAQYYPATRSESVNRVNTYVPKMSDFEGRWYYDLKSSNKKITIEYNQTRAKESQLRFLTTNDKDFVINKWEDANIVDNNGKKDIIAKGRYLLICTVNKQNSTSANRYKPSGYSTCIRVTDTGRPTNPPYVQIRWVPPGTPPDNGNPGTQFPNIPDGGVGPPVQPDPNDPNTGRPNLPDTGIPNLPGTTIPGSGKHDCCHIYYNITGDLVIQGDQNNCNWWNRWWNRRWRNRWNR